MFYETDQIEFYYNKVKRELCNMTRKKYILNLSFGLLLIFVQFKTINASSDADLEQK